jgi:hypothetical protein
MRLGLGGNHARVSFGMELRDGLYETVSDLCDL